MTAIEILPHHPDPWGGVKGQIIKFHNNSASCQYLYWNLCRQRNNKYETYQTWFSIKGLCPTPWVDLGGRVKCSKLNFSEHGHVAYQITENTECNSMVANILPAVPYPNLRPWGQKVRIQLVQNLVMLHIKIIGNHVMQQHSSKYFARRTPHGPRLGFNRSKFIEKHGNK